MSLPVDLLFHGSKVIWEAHLTSDIYIVVHPSFNVVEVVCCVNIFFSEPARIYLKHSTLVDFIKQSIKSEVHEFGDALVNFNRRISTFIYEHLEIKNYVPRNRHFDIIIKVDKTEQPDPKLELSKPDGLEPYDIITAAASIK